MNSIDRPVQRPGFLARLKADQSGNIIALTAAAVLPVIAIVGGVIDISLLYGVHTRIQAACDAGALSGRRVMGSSAWSSTTETAAYAMFSANFANNFFGVTNLVKDFNGANGRVTGTVTADVPMTLMRVFGQETRSVTVTCTSEMRIPHTDVMFVLDTTGSMNCAPGDTIDGANGTPICFNNGGVEKPNSRMKGLRKSVNCFYETLGKLDTGEICDTVNGDPAPTGLAAGIQLRIGFMPYSSNINVGKLLPTSYFENSWSYQSRSPIISNINVWTDKGTENLGAYGNWSPSSRPAGTPYTAAANFSSIWTSMTGSGTTTAVQIGGTNVALNNVIARATSANCANNNSIDSSRLRAVGDAAGTPGTDIAGAYTIPVYAGSPTGNRSTTRTQPVTNTVAGYRYAWVSGQCRLQTSPGKTSTPDTRWNQSRTRTGTTPIAWSTVRELTGWTLKPRSIDVSGLKNGTNWNSSLSVADFGYASATVNKSGSGSSSTIYVPTSITASWGGCIEERQTYKNIDANPTDEWDPIPAAAFDMDIDTAPNGTANSKWGPALQDLIYQRSSGGRTLSTLTTAANSGSDKLNSLACPSEASRLKVYTNGTEIRTYTGLLTPGGGTYHDIGLLWGARFISPTGIFGTTNSSDASGNNLTIQRHIIFMTDGDTATCSSSYTPYGISWWDRRQTNKANPDDDSGTASCTNSYTNSIVDARTAALCTAIKNKNITLWVVSFGAGVNAASEARLSACASSRAHFYDASNTADLQNSFKEIALQISRLRLQN